MLILTDLIKVARTLLLNNFLLSVYRSYKVIFILLKVY